MTQVFIKQTAMMKYSWETNQPSNNKSNRVSWAKLQTGKKHGERLVCICVRVCVRAQ